MDRIWSGEYLARQEPELRTTTIELTSETV